MMLTTCIVTRLNAENVRGIGDFFFHRAKEHLQKIEAGGGDITTVQALIIMTIREVSWLASTHLRRSYLITSSILFSSDRTDYDQAGHTRVKQHGWLYT